MFPIYFWPRLFTIHWINLHFLDSAARLFFFFFGLFVCLFFFSDTFLLDSVIRPGLYDVFLIFEQPDAITSSLFHIPANFQTLKKNQCDCPVPCGAISYEPYLSYAAFPSEGYLSRFFKAGENNTYWTSEKIKQTQQWLR